MLVAVIAMVKECRFSGDKGGKEMKSSVKVMRSYDYCHFEISLSSDEEMTIPQINEMRKDAARLVDEAVRQYIIAKIKMSATWTLQKASIFKQADIIRQKPISEWTPEDKAIMKIIADKNYDEQWDYGDDEEYADND